MPFTNGIDVTTGDAILASTTDNLADNTEFNREKADVEHNFDITTGTGYHKAITQLITDAAGAVVKDLLTSEWDPASGSATIGQAIRYLAKMPDSAGNQDIFGALRWIADAVTSTSEEGRAVLAIMAAGTLTDQLELSKNLLAPSTDSVLDIGSATKRIKGVYLDTLGDSGQDLTMNASAELKPNIPLAIVRDVTDDNDVTGDGTTYTLIMATEVADQGADWDGTSTFTAPVTGKYLASGIFVLGGLTASHTSGYVNINTSNRGHIVFSGNFGAMRDVAGGDRLYCSGCVVTDMDAADTLQFQVTVSGGTKVVDIISGYIFSIMQVA